MANISRRKARKESVIILYQSDLLKKDVDEIIRNEVMFGKNIDAFTRTLVYGVTKNRTIIDSRIKEVVQNWSLERIAIIDRNIIRVGIYEMLFEDEIPLKVSIDEAIEISKEIGQNEDTPKFVNGVLGKVLIEINEGKEQK